MRALTKAELDSVCGGLKMHAAAEGTGATPVSGVPIYGTPPAPPVTYFPVPSTPAPPPLNGPPAPPAPYHIPYTVLTDPHASPAARSFAASHLKNLMSSKDTNATQEAQYITAALEEIYDDAKANPGAKIQLGNGQSITAGQLLQDVSAVTIELTTNTALTGPYGARTSGYITNPIIGINPDSQGVQAYDANGTPGFDYSVLHELGHAVEEISEGYNASTEANANTTGNSIANFIDIPDLSNPPFGFG